MVMVMIYDGDSDVANGAEEIESAGIFELLLYQGSAAGRGSVNSVRGPPYCSLETLVLVCLSLQSERSIRGTRVASSLFILIRVKCSAYWHTPTEGGGQGVRLRFGDDGGAAAGHAGARPFLCCIFHPAFQQNMAVRSVACSL